MLELRPTCEHCNKLLPPDSTQAMICTFECTFCRDCVHDILENVCPNCGGGFTPRPIRPKQNLKNENYLGKYPASEKVVYKPVNVDAHKSFADFNTAASIKLEHFNCLKGEDLFSAYESRPGKKRRFCSKCGSQMVAEYTSVPYLVLRVATLDEDPGYVPEQQIWHSHEVPWMAYDIDIPKYPEWEPGHGK